MTIEPSPMLAPAKTTAARATATVAAVFHVVRLPIAFPFHGVRFPLVELSMNWARSADQSAEPG